METGYCEICGVYLGMPKAFQHADLRDCIRILKAEIDHLQSWDGLMEILDHNYPADVFDGSSGDPGPQIVVLLREIGRLRWSEAIGEEPT